MPQEVTLNAVVVMLGLVALLAIIGAVAEPFLARRQRRRDERARLRAVVAVMHMFNGAADDRHA